MLWKSILAVTKVLVSILQSSSLSNHSYRNKTQPPPLQRASSSSSSLSSSYTTSENCAVTSTTSTTTMEPVVKATTTSMTTTANVAATNVDPKQQQRAQQTSAVSSAQTTKTTVVTSQQQQQQRQPSSSSFSSSSAKNRNSGNRNDDAMVDGEYYRHPNAGYVIRERGSTTSSSASSSSYHKCQWQNYHGTIIAGSTAIVFRGSFFLFDKTVVLAWDNIRQVVLIDPSLNSNSINDSNNNNNNNSNNNNEIEIIMSDETVHSFLMNQQQNQHSTTKIWLSLLSLHNDALLGLRPPPQQQISALQTTTGTTTVTSNNSTPTNTPRESSKGRMATVDSTAARSYERRNSDPASSTLLMSSPEFNNDDTVDTNSDHHHHNNNNNNTTSSNPIIHIITSTVDELSIDTVMVHAGSPLRLQPIHCTYSNITTTTTTTTDGRLYIGSHAIVFTGKQQRTTKSFYLTSSSYWDHSIIIIPWTTIQRIQQQQQQPQLPVEQMQNAGKSPNLNGVRVVTKGETTISTDADAKNKPFDFCNIETPDQVWASLVAIHNEKLLSLSSMMASSSTTTVTPNHQHTYQTESVLSGSKKTAPQLNPADSSSHRRKSHRRTNSDPMMTSVKLNFDNYHVDGDAVDVTVKENGDPQTTTVTTAKDTIGPPLISPAAVVTGSGAAQSDIWLSIKNQTTSSTTGKNVYSNVVIDHEVVNNCTLDHFYDTFLSDSSPFSLERFLTERGDFDVRTTKWEEDTTTKADAVSTTTSDLDAAQRRDHILQPRVYKRVIKYMHPVNVPLAPPQAGARKEQTLTRYGNVGICIVTQTFVDDVPMTDCFYVADRMLIEPTIENRDVTIRMEFGITFVKSTMFKGIISKKTAGEFIVLFNALARYISDAIVETQKNASILKDGTVDNKETIASANHGINEIPLNVPIEKSAVTLDKTPKSFVSVERILLFAIVIIQLWMILELKGLKHAIVSLERHQHTYHHSLLYKYDNNDVTQ